MSRRGCAICSDTVLRIDFGFVCQRVHKISSVKSQFLIFFSRRRCILRAIPHAYGKLWIEFDEWEPKRREKRSLGSTRRKNRGKARYLVILIASQFPHCTLLFHFMVWQLPSTTLITQPKGRVFCWQRQVQLWSCQSEINPLFDIQRGLPVWA